MRNWTNETGAVGYGSSDPETVLEVEEKSDPVSENEVCPLCHERTTKAGGPNPMVSFHERNGVADSSSAEWRGCVRCLEKETSGSALSKILVRIVWLYVTGCEFPNSKESVDFVQPIAGEDSK